MSGRIRTIKPELLEDEACAALSDAAWRLFVSLWLLADDYGCVRFGEKYIAASVWQDTSTDASAPITELVKTRFVLPYAVSEQRYGLIRGFTKHQRIDNAGKRRVPSPEEDDGSLPTWFRAHRRILADSSANPEVHSPTLREPGSQLPGSPLDHDHDLDHDPTTTPTTRAPAKPSHGVAKRDPKGAHLAPDWKPTPETLEAFRLQGVDASACVAEFADYWIAVPGAKGRKLDWDATFRNRVRQLVDQGRAPAWREQAKPSPAPAALPLPGPEEQAQIAEAQARFQTTMSAISESMKPRLLRDVEANDVGADVRWSPNPKGAA